jgi:hypothetical protein
VVIGQDCRDRRDDTHDATPELNKTLSRNIVREQLIANPVGVGSKADF